MVNLSLEQSGELRPGVWFSTLFYSALQARFTGVIQLRDAQGDRALFFRSGDPVHAGGLGFQGHYLGQLVAELGLLPTNLVREALERHQALPQEERPLLGTFLVQSFGLSGPDLKQAVIRQCEGRFEACFGLAEGTAYHALPGENDRIKSIAVKVDGWSLLLRGLRSSSSDAELRATADSLLGRSVKMKGSLRQLEALMTVPRDVASGLRYLDRPRKPDQLERTLRRRKARSLLRLLELLDLLETHPASKAIPIASVSRVRPGPDTGQSEVIEPDRPTTTRTSSDPSPTPAPPPPSKRRARPASKPRSDEELKRQSLFAEIDRFYAELENGLDHFAVLQVERNVSSDGLRERQLELVRRFHPDNFPGENVPDDILSKAQAISSAVNAAYDILKFPEARAEYERGLANGTIRGDGRRQDLIREAQIKTTKALHYIKRRQFAEAREHLQRALDLDPQAKGVKPYLAWAMYSSQRDGDTSAEPEVIRLLEEALKDEPENPDVYYYLGRVLKDAEDLERAYMYFKKASDLDPRYHKALSEMRVLRGQLEKKQKTGRTDIRSILSRFFAFLLFWL